MRELSTKKIMEIERDRLFGISKIVLSSPIPDSNDIIR